MPDNPGMPEQTASQSLAPDTGVPAYPTFSQAFWYWLQLGCVSFGGPAGQIALMHQELVDRKRWISERRFLHALNYCMLLPGPEAQQLAIYMGWLLHRTRGGPLLGATETDLPLLLDKIHALGPKLVFITDGIAGAYASDGKEKWFMPIYPHTPVERTGAGDAFAATVSAGLLLGLPLTDALRWGPINSMSVTQYVGAQEGLLSQEKIKALLEQAPADYEPKHLF